MLKNDVDEAPPIGFNGLLSPGEVEGNKLPVVEAGLKKLDPPIPADGFEVDGKLKVEGVLAGDVVGCPNILP